MQQVLTLTLRCRYSAGRPYIAVYGGLRLPTVNPVRSCPSRDLISVSNVVVPGRTLPINDRFYYSVTTSFQTLETDDIYY